MFAKSTKRSSYPTAFGAYYTLNVRPFGCNMKWRSPYSFCTKIQTTFFVNHVEESHLQSSLLASEDLSAQNLDRGRHVVYFRQHRPPVTARSPVMKLLMSMPRSRSEDHEWLLLCVDMLAPISCWQIFISYSLQPRSSFRFVRIHMLIKNALCTAATLMVKRE
jgi:hypothetical protein